MPGGALPVERGDEVIPVINRIQDKYDLVVATQDWHPAKHGSFASAHKGAQLFEERTLGGLPDHCVQMTHGAELVADLDQRLVEVVFRKGMDPKIDSYSGFFDNGRKKATGLADYLKGKGVEAVHVCGLAADYCVYYTAMDALDLGFKASIIEAATRPISATGFEAAKQEFLARGGWVE
mgnify:CR=1 FL=1